MTEMILALYCACAVVMFLAFAGVSEEPLADLRWDYGRDPLVHLIWWWLIIAISLVWPVTVVWLFWGPTPKEID